MSSLLVGILVVAVIVLALRNGDLKREKDLLFKELCRMRDKEQENNPELVAAQAQRDIEEWVSNPLGAKLASGLKQMGIDPVQAATGTTVPNAKDESS
jgi:hypothetical protein